MCHSCDVRELAGDQLPAGAVGHAGRGTARPTASHARAVDVVQDSRRPGDAGPVGAQRRGGRPARCCDQPVDQDRQPDDDVDGDEHHRGQRRVGRARARRTASGRVRVVLGALARRRTGTGSRPRRRACSRGRSGARTADSGSRSRDRRADNRSGRRPRDRRRVGWVMRVRWPQRSMVTDSMTTGVDRSVHRAGAGGADRVHDVARGLVGDLTEDRVLAVEPRGGARG